MVLSLECMRQYFQNLAIQPERKGAKMGLVAGPGKGLVISRWAAKITNVLTIYLVLELCR